MSPYVVTDYCSHRVLQLPRLRFRRSKQGAKGTVEVLIVAFLATVFGGYGNAQQAKATEPHGVVTGVFAVAPATPSTRVQAPARSDLMATQGQLQTYRIGDDDMLAISVWHEPELSRTIPVRPDGKISIPLVGEMQAAGKSALELQEDLREALTKYIKEPAVTVIVAEIRSQRINVVGEVSRPGAFPLSESMGVVDAVAQAGGLREFAKRNQIYVLRPSGGGHNIRLQAHYEDVLRGRKNAKDIVLQAHDTVVIP